MKELNHKKTESGKYIFIVGVPRSGTKYLKNILGAHSMVHISHETHFFSTLLHNGVTKYLRRVGSIKDDDKLRKLVDLMYSGAITGSFWKKKNLRIDKSNLVRKLEESDRSERALFEILLQEDRRSHNKPIGGEKTPSHIYHVAKIKKWFPNARIIHIVRDPRAVLASEIKKKNKPDYPIKKRGFLYAMGLLVYVLIDWFLAQRLDEKYQKKYRGSYLCVKYEELLNNHEKKVQELCEFLDLPFERSILSPDVKDSSYTVASVPIENKWKRVLPSWMSKSIKIVLGKHMEKLQYQ